MGIFDFLKKRQAPRSEKFEGLEPKSRIESLINSRHQRMEGVRSTDGLTFSALVERQLEQGKTTLALGNISSQIKGFFELANLYWGQGEMDKTQEYLNKTLEKHQRYVEVVQEHSAIKGLHHKLVLAKAASILLEKPFEAPENTHRPDPGYAPWFWNSIYDYCLTDKDFDAASWQASEDQWTKNRFPKYRLEDFGFYVKALTGQFDDANTLLSCHEKMFKARAKKRPDVDMLEAHDEDNTVIIDHIFACILKRIGWEGHYRHSWPNTQPVNSDPGTNQEPSNFLKIIG